MGRFMVQFDQDWLVIPCSGREVVICYANLNYIEMIKLFTQVFFVTFSV
jgi:hypothetical protein